jgi:hypothetical protein
MKDIKDITGANIIIGDFIAYTTRQSSSMTTHIGRVERIEFDKDSTYCPYTLKVVSVKKAWRWSGDRFERYDKTYPTTLTSNDTIVILSHVPEHIRTLVSEYRAR